MIWDGASIHRATEVKDFLADGWTKVIHLERFPAYAPELNPDEGVWQHLKHLELRNVCCINFAHLSIELDQRSGDYADDRILFDHFLPVQS